MVPFYIFVMKANPSILRRFQRKIQINEIVQVPEGQKRKLPPLSQNYFLYMLRLNCHSTKTATGFIDFIK